MVWIDQFVELMSGATISGRQIDQAFALKDQNLPRYIYKFRKFNDYSVANLRDDTVWLCSTDQYNDPYECSASIDEERISSASMRLDADKYFFDRLPPGLSPDELRDLRAAADPRRAFVYMQLRKEPTVDPGSINTLVSELFAASASIHSKSVADFVSTIQKGTKVCSFSDRNDSTVMWGHYADSHRGFCIGYDLTSIRRDDIRRRMLFPVVYSNDLFDVTQYIEKSMEGGPFNNLYGQIAATRKSADWAYEQEWRLVFPLGASFADRNYRMFKPSGLYIGSRTPPADEAVLLRAAAAKGIPAYRMRLSTTKIEMVPEQVLWPLRS